MKYKRMFGKKGLVALLAHRSAISDKKIMEQVHAACEQCGVDSEYTIDTYSIDNDPNSSFFEPYDYDDAALDIMGDGYRVAVTVGETPHNAIFSAMKRFKKNIMVIGLRASDLDDEDTFRLSNLDPMFEKNLTEENRWYVIDQLSVQQVKERLAEREREAKKKEEVVYEA